MLLQVGPRILAGPVGDGVDPDEALAAVLQLRLGDDRRVLAGPRRVPPHRGHPGVVATEGAGEGHHLVELATHLGIAFVQPRAERLGLPVHRVVAGQVDHVQVEPFREPGLEGERFREMEPGLKEQDGDVPADPDGHVDQARALELEGRGDGDAVQPGILQRPPHDLLRGGLLEPGVEVPDEVFG